MNGVLANFERHFPGYYYLFALDDSGTPSVAEIVHLLPDASIELASLPELIDPQDLLENCAYSEEGGWGWDAVAGQSCRPIPMDGNVDAACDYSQADLYGGHGWNPVTETSCDPLDREEIVPVVVVDACDYSRAGEYNGWGWNPVTFESCPPRADSVIEEITKILTAETRLESDSNCDYSNALVQNGWGWNPVTGQSCPPVQ